jgi:hypothetical protein
MARSTMGPNVNVPSTWQHLIQPSSSNSQAMGSQASGYSSHHAHYGSECKRWAKLSYAIPAAQTISLEISLFMRAGSGERVVVALPLGYVFYLQNCGLVINDISLEHL